jgi:hypothetical protein
MATSRAQARTLVKQSVTAAQNQTRLESLRANADVVKGVEQISTFDNRTTEICMAYSGGTWDLDGEPILGCSLPFNNGPPHHWNCRSVLVPITKSYEELGINQRELPAGTRASMNGQVAADMSFDKWLKGQPKSIQIELLGQTKAALFRSGKLALRDLVDQTGRKLSVQSISAKAVAATESTKSKIITTYVKDFQAQNGRMPTLAEFQEFAANNLNMKAAQAKRWYNARIKNMAAPPAKPAAPAGPTYRPGSKTAILQGEFRKGVTREEFVKFAYDNFNMKATQAERYFARFTKEAAPKPVPGGPPAAPSAPVGPTGEFALPAHYLPGTSYSQYNYLGDAFEKLHDMGLYAPESWTRFQKFLQIRAQQNNRLVAMLVQRDNVGDIDVRYKNLQSTISDLSKDVRLREAARKIGNYKDPMHNLGPVDALYYMHTDPGIGGYTCATWNHVSVYIKPSTKFITKEVMESEGTEHFMKYWVEGIRKAVKTQLETRNYQPRWHVGPTSDDIYVPRDFSKLGVAAYYQLPNHQRKAITDLADMLYSYIHEFGHQSHYHTLYLSKPPKGIPALSRYGKVHYTEWHAENFVAYIFARDELLKDAVGKKLVKYFDDAFDNFIKLFPSTGVKP